MSEQISGEQLERASYDPQNNQAVCAECGASIELDEGDYGVSLDGEKYCCWDCMKEAVKISSYHHTTIGDYWSASATLGNVEVSIRNQPDQQTALKEAFNLAEINWEGVPAYIEV